MSSTFTTNHVFSPTTLWFYAVALQASYVAAGTWPADAVAITDDEWQQFVGQPPAGQMLGQQDGMPVWVARPAPPTPTLAQQAQTQLGQGLAVSSTSDPAFAASYAIDSNSQGKIGAVSTYILVNSKFPGGLATYPWLDMTGTAHVFASTTMFQDFATQVADYVAALDMIIATNTGTLPDPTAVIA